MKSIKLISAITLATGSILGSSITSANAQFITRQGNGYSERGEDEQLVINTFILFDKKANGQLILDGNISEEIGIFNGAVEDYSTYSPFFNSGAAGADIELDMLPNPDQFAELANLEVRLFRNSELISDLGLTGGFIGDIVEYKIVGQGIGSNEPDPISFYLLNPDDTSVISSFPSLPGDFTSEKATNDLTYILDNDLLNLGIPFNRVSDIDNALALNQNPFFPLAGIKFEQTISSTTSVPEFSSIKALLALGVLGLGFSLKRKKSVRF